MSEPAPILLISAMAEEIDALQTQLPGLDPLGPLGPVPLWQKINGRGRRIILGQCGIGKVNAAMAAALMIQAYSPKAVLVIGVAGGLDPVLSIGDVVISTELRQSDYGALSDGELTPFRPGIPPLPGFESEPLGFWPPARVMAALMNLAQGDPLPPVGEALPRPGKLVTGTILSGDVFMDCAATRKALVRTHGARAFEMEGGAVAQVCEQMGPIPCVSVRCLTDLAGGRPAEGNSRLDFATFLPAAAERAATASLRVLKVLE